MFNYSASFLALNANYQAEGQASRRLLVPLAIGANTQPITMPATGQLFLGINDDHFEDNSGTYTVTLTRLGL